jgi:hypothetical protein
MVESNARRKRVKMDGYELIEKLNEIVKDMVLVPNSWLPENFRDNRTDSVSLSDLENKCDSMERGETDHEEEKREKARRVELYRGMIESGQEITYLRKGM